MNILLAGDSTVTKQDTLVPGEFGRNYCGWGQVFQRYFPLETVVYNYAVSGYTVETFREGENSRYDQLRAQAQPGDVALFQFGHNDQKRPHLGAMGGYAEGLRAYIDELRAMSVQPVLVTPLCRNSWRGDNGEYSDLLAPYADAMKVVADEKDVPLADLHGESLRWIKKSGREHAKRYFYPGDYTHPNEKGGLLFASMVARVILACGHPDLERLKKQVLPEDRWPDALVSDALTDPKTGWVYPPLRRTGFDFLADDGIVTAEQALRMAREGYGYFVSIHTSAVGSAFEYWCAAENAYLPEDYPEEKALQIPVKPEQLRKTLLLACAGRNCITEEAKMLKLSSIAGDRVLAADAKRYAFELEHLTTGAIDKQRDENVPAGS